MLESIVKPGEARANSESSKTCRPVRECLRDTRLRLSCGQHSQGQTPARLAVLEAKSDSSPPQPVCLANSPVDRASGPPGKLNGSSKDFSDNSTNWSLWPPSPAGEDEGEEIARVLCEEAWAHRLSRANESILRRMRLLVGSGPFARPLTILQVGVGSGDFSVHLARWCRANDVPVEIVGVDCRPEAIELAAHRTRDFPEISVQRAERCEGAIPGQARGQYDFVIASQFLHSLSKGVRPDAVRYLYSLSRTALVVGETLRHPAAYCSLWLGTRLTLCTKTVRRRLPRGVSDSETLDGWKELFDRSGIAVVRFMPSWPWQVCAIAWKTVEEREPVVDVLDAVPSIATSA